MDRYHYMAKALEEQRMIEVMDSCEVETLHIALNDS